MTAGLIINILCSLRPNPDLARAVKGVDYSLAAKVDGRLAAKTSGFRVILCTQDLLVTARHSHALQEAAYHEGGPLMDRPVCAP